jgi:serine/threonine protein kinase/ABC-type glycerol-3-phosphate transport system substrate-binding protein
MINLSEWIGLEIAGGRYRILGRIGEGSMGQIYRAYDCHLETDVVLKFPVASDETSVGLGLMDRFEREIHALIRLSHPHIVKVFDVGELEGHPYVVMQYLGGGSLKTRLESGPRGEACPMSAASLHDWLLDVARALDFIHDQHHIHRDVKPANILFDEHANAFLGDFGVIKALAGDEAGWLANSSTAPGFLLGTPNYIAPEIVMGRPFDGRADQYALAMTVHEVLTGTNCMAGPSPSATMVNQTTIVPPALVELVPGLPVQVSLAIARALAKDPEDRFERCGDLAHEVLADLPFHPPSAATTIKPRPDLDVPQGSIPCPSCRSPVPVGRGRVGEQVRCPRCRAVARIDHSPSDSLILRRVDAPATFEAEADVPVLYPPDPSAVAESDRSSWTGSRFLPAPSHRAGASRSGRRFAAASAALAIALLAAVLGWGLRGRRPEGGPARPDGAAVPPTITAGPVAINIAYGTEKEKWLKEALAAFEETPEGRRIKVNLVGLGSVEGAQAVLDGPGEVPIHVWSPASSAYRDVFVQEWRIKHATEPILHAENLALTPMVFVLWKSRYEPFVKKYGAISFQAIAEAMREPGGWGTIAGEPGWGLFKFGHTHPNKSNSGLLTLVLMAYAFSQKERALTTADVTQPEFQKWLREFEQGVARPGGSLTHSTGTLMREMVLRGPSQYDCLMVYENLAIDYLDDARQRWEELQVVYPVPNLWNEHPYYILNVPWSGPEHREAAKQFLDFLTSKPTQRRALDHGFRPGNPAVSVRFPESPLVRHEAQGLMIDLPRVCEPPRAEVVYDLIASFRRIER